MRRFTIPLAATALAIAATPTPIVAQGAFDMGQLTATVSTDHVTQSERARAQRGNPNRVTSRQAAACAGLPQFRAQYGANNPKVMKLTRLCRNAGY